MAIESGQQLLHYRIVEKIGEGAMGQVWKAVDTTLDREVAIKILPKELAEDAGRLNRFQREAKLLASLNHPNIATVHGLHEAGAVRFIAMELVAGQDLAVRLKAGRMPLTETLAVARQIAEALEAAHEAGIVHRDLKPANILLTPIGQVKVLDFGLAKGAEKDPAHGGVSLSPTMTSGGTQAGMIVGTPSYMSPEQAKGQAVDRRTDIWAFGVVLLEMLSGQRPFDGDSISEVLAAVLMRDPDWSALPEDVPPAVRTLLRRCLQREPRSRLQHIGDARIVLDEVAGGTVDAPAPPASSTRWTRAQWLLACAVLFACIGTGFVLDRLIAPRPGEADAASFHGELEISPPAQADFVSGLALSPDGRRLVFAARGEDGRTSLWVRELDSPEAQALPGTLDARYPFWSPDGQQLGFFAQSSLKVVGLLGGSPRVVAETGGKGEVRGGAWGADDRIVFAPTYTGPLYSVAAAGGEVSPATEILKDRGIGTQRLPNFLPDGRRFVFFASSGTGIEPGKLCLGRVGTLETKELGPASSTALWAEPGHLVYIQGETLVAQRFDLDREELVGQPASLGILMPGNINFAGQRSLAVSRNGILVYRVDKHEANQLVWVDREGNELETLAGDIETGYYWPSLSPDGRRLAVSQYEPSSTGGSIWVYDLERNLTTRRTFDDGDDTLSIWSPDGSEIAYSSARDKNTGVYRGVGNDAGKPQPWVLSETIVFPYAWLADGPRLLYTSVAATGGSSLWVRAFGEDAVPRRLGPGHVNEDSPDLSPDGKWIAFQSDASSRMEIYLRRFDDTTGSTTNRVSKDGGRIPRWRPDGRELFYVDDAGRLVSVPMKSMDPLQPGTPQPLFAARLDSAPYRQYDVAPDGRRFILSRTVFSSDAPISVVIGWQERLRQE